MTENEKLITAAQVSVEGGLSDNHIHSRSSFDSDEPVTGHCESAVAAGLTGITVTDHCELIEDGMSEMWSFETMRQSHLETREAAKLYSGKLDVLAGVELGQPEFDRETAKRVLDADWDFVLASVHYLRNGDDFYYLDYHERDPHQIYSDYLREMLLMAENSDFDSLAHITYPLRYIVVRQHVDFDETPYYEMYDRILTAVSQRRKAIEINTKTTSHGESLRLPDDRMLRRFRELGGKYVTIGSDAHTADATGGGIAEGVSAVKNAGFEYITRYSGRKPVLFKLS